MTQFGSARADLEGHYLRTLDLCGDLGERIRSGSRAERLRTTPDQPNTDRFLGAFAGIVPPERYFTLGTVLRVFGTRGIRKLTTAGVSSSARTVPRPRVPGWLPGGDRCGR